MKTKLIPYRLLPIAYCLFVLWSVVLWSCGPANAATTTEVNIANLPQANDLSLSNSVLVVTNNSKARLATLQSVKDLIGGGGDTVWTNDGTHIDLIGFTNSAGASQFRISPAGTLLQLSGDDGTSYATANLTASPSSAYSQLDLVGSTNQAGTNISEIIISADAISGPAIQVIAHDATVFAVSGSGAITLGSTTNQITFGGTNTAPSVTTNAAKWISVKVGSFTNAYRIPLYE